MIGYAVARQRFSRPARRWLRSDPWWVGRSAGGVAGTWRSSIEFTQDARIQAVGGSPDDTAYAELTAFTGKARDRSWSFGGEWAVTTDWDSAAGQAHLRGSEFVDVQSLDWNDVGRTFTSWVSMGSPSAGRVVHQIQARWGWEAPGVFQPWQNEQNFPDARCDVEGQSAAGRCVLPQFKPTMAYGLGGANPAVAQHIWDAQVSGLPGAPGDRPLVRLFDPSFASVNGDTACPRGVAWLPRPTGYSCDEYPFWSTQEGAFTGGGEPERSTDASAAPQPVIDRGRMGTASAWCPKARTSQREAN